MADVKTEELMIVLPKQPFPWRLAARDFIFISFDMAMVAVSFYMAWGLTIKSWWWFIGVGIFGRYFSSLFLRVYLDRRPATPADAMLEARKAGEKT